MKLRLFLLGLIMPLNFLLSGLAFAEENRDGLFWVAGSFSDEAVAREEGLRISQASGLDVLYAASDVSGTTYYRLLVPINEVIEDRSSVKLQLESAGITSPWLLKMDDALAISLSSSDTRREDLYLVLGSFDNYTDARGHGDRILEDFNQISEQSVIRVITGPYVDQTEVEVAKEMFLDGNIEDVWVIKLESQGKDILSEYKSYKRVDYSDRQASKEDRKLIQKEATLKNKNAPENTISPGFNLARLKKRPAD
jgi:hypothetical protein